MKQLSVSRLARGCLVMLSSLSSAENVAEREETGGNCADSSEAHFIVPGERGNSPS